jgi:hypothetical protein
LGGRACYDGVDNEADGAIDGDDPDCQFIIATIRFAAEATGEYETLNRYFAILCYRPGSYFGSVFWSVGGTAVDTNVSNNSGQTDFWFGCG